MNHTVIRLRHLFAGADEGYFTLPAPVIEARTAAEVLKQATIAPQRGNEEELAVNLVDAAAQGQLPAGWQKEVRPHALAAEYHNAAAAVLRAARDRVDDRVLSVTLNLGDTILAQHLRPKLDEAVTLVRPYADDATDLPWGVPTRMFAPEYAPVVDALGRGAAIYFAIRRGQSVLRETRGAPGDEAHLYFGEFRSGVRAHWPTFRTQRQTRRPWDDLEGPARFAWLVANMPDDLWMPTADECDEAYRAAVASSRLRPSPVG